LGRFISDKTRDFLKLVAQVSSMGLAMALAIVIGLAAGIYVDKWLGTAPWGFFIGLLLGIVAGFRNIWVIAKRAGML
jgi:ATP synthase protein I